MDATGQLHCLWGAASLLCPWTERHISVWYRITVGTSSSRNLWAWPHRCGIFVIDPTLGYPPGVPGNGPATLHGSIHNYNGLLNFIVLASAIFVFARRFTGDSAWKGWALFSIITGVLVIVFFFASGIASYSPLPGAPAGLFQRVAIVVGWGWIACFAWMLLNKLA